MSHGRASSGARQPASSLRIAAFRLLCPQPVATAHFYEAAFGAQLIEGETDPSVLIGEQRILFTQSTHPMAGYPPSNATSFQHFALVVTDMELAYLRLREVGGWTPISRDGPEHLSESSGGVKAFKFRDPDGHPLEFLHFPAKSVPPPWQGKDGVVLGIDHSAITVSDTARSVVFYQELGFKVRQRGENKGIEQERMDDVDRPLVEVTGLAPPGGGPPHLELLRYREPTTIKRPVRPENVLATRMIFAEEGAEPHADLAIHADPDGHRFER